MEGTISAESYPTSIRGTCYGLSAAIGKVGAVAGTQTFSTIQSRSEAQGGKACADGSGRIGPQYTFIIAACCGLVGVALAWFFVEDKGKDRLEKEDEMWRQYLVDHGYADLQMGDGSVGNTTNAAANRESEALEFEK